MLMTAKTLLKMMQPQRKTLTIQTRLTPMPVRILTDPTILTLLIQTQMVLMILLRKTPDW